MGYTSEDLYQKEGGWLGWLSGQNHLLRKHEVLGLDPLPMTTITLALEAGRDGKIAGAGWPPLYPKSLSSEFSEHPVWRKGVRRSLSVYLQLLSMHRYV